MIPTMLTSRRSRSAGILPALVFLPTVAGSVKQERAGSPRSGLARSRASSDRIPGEHLGRALQRLQARAHHRQELVGEGLGRPAVAALGRADDLRAGEQEDLVLPHAEDLAGDVLGG